MKALFAVPGTETFELISVNGEVALADWLDVYLEGYEGDIELDAAELLDPNVAVVRAAGGGLIYATLTAIS